MQSASDTPSDAGSAPPAVRLIVPTRDPGPWFESTIQSIADQDYPDVRVTIIHDPGEAPLLDRFAERLDGVDLMSADADEGFGAKINRVVADTDEPLLLFCHDDVALDVGVVSVLVREWRRRADTPTMIAPKLLDWTDPSRLVPAGFDADRFGETAALVKPGDLDQGQHDKVAEVFGVSTACLLIGRELFQSIGGFDPAIDWHGEAHDLSLRARVAGAQVLITSGTSVRHRASFAERDGASEVLRMRRHQMRSVLVSAKGLELVMLLFGFMALHAVELVVAMVRLDLAELRSIPGAWLWNLRHLRSLRQRREIVDRVRVASGDDLSGVRRRGSVRLSDSIDRRVLQREEANARGETTLSVTRAAAASVISLLLLFGARHLLTRTIPAVGELRLLPTDLGTLTDDWWSGWRDWGMGAEGSAPFAYPLLDLAGLATFGNESLLRALLIIVPLPLGVLGAWRLFRTTTSARAPVAAAALYAASPLPYNAMNGGSLSALMLYASLPWVLGHLIAISRSEMFARRNRRSVSIVGLVALLALLGAFVPWAAVTFAVVVAGLALGSFLGGDVRGVLPLISVSVLALAGAALLNLPHLVGLTDPALFGTPGSTTGADLSLAELITANTGPVGSRTLGWAVLAPALLPLVSGTGQRFTWGMRAWGILLLTWGGAWAAVRGWLSFGTPSIEVLLAPAALALAVLGGIAALCVDRLVAEGGRRKLAPAVIAALGFGLAMFPLLDGSFTGRWSLARADLSTSLGAIEAPPEEGTYRVVWVGDAHVLGGASLPTSNDLSWSTSIDGAPDIRAAWSAADTPANRVLGDAISAGIEGRTSRLGRELSRFGVRYIVVVDQQAPVPEPSRREPVANGRAAGFASQLDLVRTGVVNPAVVVYENDAWAPVHAAVAPAALETLRLDDPAPAVTTRQSHDEWVGQVRVTRSFYASWQPSERWSLRVGDRVVPRMDVGPVGMGFESETAGEETAAVFAYATSDSHRLILGTQIFGWVVLAFLRRWIVGRERREIRLHESRAGRAA